MSKNKKSGTCKNNSILTMIKCYDKMLSEIPEIFSSKTDDTPQKRFSSPQG